MDRAAQAKRKKRDESASIPPPGCSKAVQTQAAREGASSSTSARLTSLYVQLGFADIVVRVPAQHLHLHLGGSGSQAPRASGRVRVPPASLHTRDFRLPQASSCHVAPPRSSGLDALDPAAFRSGSVRGWRRSVSGRSRDVKGWAGAGHCGRGRVGSARLVLESRSRSRPRVSPAPIPEVGSRPAILAPGRCDCRHGGGHYISSHVGGAWRRGAGEPRAHDRPGPVGGRRIGGVEHGVPPRPVREPGGWRERWGLVQPGAASARPGEDPLCW